MQRVARNSTALTLARRNFNSTHRVLVEPVPPGQTPPSRSGGNSLPLFLVAIAVGGGGYYYYTQGQPESEKAEIDREVGIGAAKAKQLADEANAQRKASAADAQAKVSGIVDQTKTGWAQTRERALQYASDAERKAHEIREKASKTSKDYYDLTAGNAKALQDESGAQARTAETEVDKKADETKSSWWSWLGWVKKDDTKKDVKTEGDQWKAAMKTEWDEVKKGPNA